MNKFRPSLASPDPRLLWAKAEAFKVSIERVLGFFSFFLSIPSTLVTSFRNSCSHPKSIPAILIFRSRDDLPSKCPGTEISWKCWSSFSFWSVWPSLNFLWLTCQVSDVPAYCTHYRIGHERFLAISDRRNQFFHLFQKTVLIAKRRRLCKLLPAVKTRRLSVRRLTCVLIAHISVFDEKVGFCLIFVSNPVFLGSGMCDVVYIDLHYV